MRKLKSWTIKELQFIKDNHDKMTVKQASKYLNRDSESVRHQSYRLGYKFKQEWEVKDYAYYKGDELVCVGKVHEISKMSGVSVDNLLKYRFKCYQNRINRLLVELEDELVV